jgi:hypothetical protein
VREVALCNTSPLLAVLSSPPAAANVQNARRLTASFLPLHYCTIHSDLQGVMSFGNLMRMRFLNDITRSKLKPGSISCAHPPLRLLSHRSYLQYSFLTGLEPDGSNLSTSKSLWLDCFRHSAESALEELAVMRRANSVLVKVAGTIPVVVGIAAAWGSAAVALNGTSCSCSSEVSPPRAP